MSILVVLILCELHKLEASEQSESSLETPVLLKNVAIVPRYYPLADVSNPSRRYISVHQKCLTKQSLISSTWRKKIGDLCVNK